MGRAARITTTLRSSFIPALLLFVASSSQGCGAGGGAEGADARPDAVPPGPTKIYQVFVTEASLVGWRVELAFGSHALAGADDDGRVTNAAARASEIYIVLSDRIGPIEEVQCVDGTYDSTDPAGGPACEDTFVVDNNRDGIPDETRLRPGAIEVVCDGSVAEIRKSLYHPTSGYPIRSPISSAGPVLKLELPFLRTSARCTLSFDELVVGLDGARVCAPEGGDIALDCVPGDTSAISFEVEPFWLIGTSPLDGEESVKTGPRGSFLMHFNVELTDGFESTVELADESGPLSLSLGYANGSRSLLSGWIGRPFDTATRYTVTIKSGPDGLTDQFGGELAEDLVFSFTTE